MPSILQNPLTRKRLRRFRARRRAWWSLWILVAAYGLSLASELICNDRPIVARCDGRWFFPVFRYYPEDAFLQNGRQTRPNYRTLHESPGFRANPKNLMLFPPVPYGPFESIDPASIRDALAVSVSFTPMPHVASLNLDEELRVSRPMAAGTFFATNDTAVEGLVLSAHWPVPSSLRTAIARRLRNESAPAFNEALASLHHPARTATFSLPAYTPRSLPPSSVRVSLRDAAPPGAAASLAFAPDGRLLTRALPPLWSKLDPGTRDNLSNLVVRAMQEYVPSSIANIDGGTYRLDVRREDVAFPCRPVPGHWMGLDNAGRDVFARILYGLRTSLTFGLLLVAATMVLGVAIGAIQGYYGGPTDIAVQRLIEIWSVIPFLYVMILLGSIYGRSFSLLLVVYGIFNWIGISYYMRAEFLRLRRQPYVEAARTLGVPGWRIMGEHILPNALTPVITFFPFSLVSAITALNGLDYLGFGLPPPTPSWGELLYQAQQFRSAWWLTLYPASAMILVLLLCVFIGEGIRDAFDPKPISRME